MHSMGGTCNEFFDSCTYSHGEALGESEHDLSLLAEAQSILKDVLELIRSEDGVHFAALEKLAKESTEDEE